MKSLQSALITFIFFLNLHGLPEETVGVVGEGSVQVSGNEMVITALDGSIFEHQLFNVSSGEKVRFDQPSNQARVLNRIVSENAAQINGTVEANGRLYFSALNGLIFDPAPSFKRHNYMQSEEDFRMKILPKASFDPAIFLLKLKTEE